MQRILTLLLFAGFCQTGLSQSDFRKGYIIDLKKDTLFGFVDYREGSRAYRTCNFKSNATEVSVYKPGEITGYGFVGYKYFASQQLFDVDSTQNLFFFEVIVEGQATLYKLDAIFYLKKDDVLHSLINPWKEVKIDGRTFQKKSNQYISTLNIYLRDCPQLSSKIQTTSLNERQLSNLISDYNKCKGSQSIIFKENKPWVKAAFGIFAGANFSTFSASTRTSAGYPHLVGDYESFISPIGGAIVDISSPRLTERLAFTGGAFFLKSSYYRYTQFTNGFVSISTNYVTIELEQLKMPIGIKYTFPERGLTPFINAGITNTINLKTTSQWINEFEANNRVHISTQEAMTIGRNELGFWGGVGVRKLIHPKWVSQFELRYEENVNLKSSITDLIAGVTNFQFFISIIRK